MSLPVPFLEMADSEHLLPSQYFAAAADSPEKALLRAVLERAVEDLGGVFASTRGPRARGRLRAEAEAWFLSEDDHYLYAFASICQHLGINASAIRRALFQPQKAAA